MVGAKGLQIFASNFWPEAGATSTPRMPNATTVSVTVANLPQHITTAQLFRIDDNVTNPYAYAKPLHPAPLPSLPSRE